MTLMPRTLSSSQTFFFKFLFPIIWMGGLTVAFFSSRSESVGHITQASSAPNDRWEILGFLIVGGCFTILGPGRNKRVRLDEQFLYVSNYFKEIQIPLSWISEVNESFLMRRQRVTIQFRTPTRFGSSISFMPEVRWFGFSGAHPVVEEIRDAARRHGLQGA